MLTENDLILRKHRITGSTVSAYLGLHPYQSPVDAWEVNEGIRTLDENDLMRMGHRLEPGLAAEAAHRLGWGFYQYPSGTVLHPEHPAWWAATPDVLGDPALAQGVQIKCHQPWMAEQYPGRPGESGAYGNEAVPLHELMQCQWEMAVFGAREWWLGVFFHIGDFRLYRILRDDALLTAMRERAFAFWQRHLDPAGPKERPSNDHWNPNLARPRAKPRPAKVSTEHLNETPPVF